MKICVCDKKIMKCPACKEKVSVFDVSNKFKCNSCGQALTCTNNSLASILFFATWVGISGFAYISNVDSAVFIDVFIAPLVAFCLYFLVVKIDIERN